MGGSEIVLSFVGRTGGGCPTSIPIFLTTCFDRDMGELMGML
jgi:hypothetical protein